MFDYSRFYRIYTQHLRKYYEVSQQNLAKAIQIPNSSLSKIEAGKQEIDEKTFKKVIDFFEKIDEDFRFSFDPDLIEEVESWIRKSVHAFLMMTYESMAYEIKPILDNSKYLHSFAYFHIQLLQGLYDNFLDIDCMEQIKELIDSDYFQDHYHLAVLYDLYGVSIYSMDKKVLKTQIQALHTALSYCNSIDSQNLKGLILYHLILKQKIAGNFTASLEHSDECEHNLQKAGAYRRLIHAKLNKGNIYAELHLYTLAEKLYRELELSQSQIDEKNIRPRTYESYSWCSLIQENNEIALLQAKKAKKAGSKFTDIYITLAYANYKLGNLEEARQSILEFRALFSSSPRTDFIQQFFVLLEKRIENKLLPALLIERLLNQLPDFRDVELEMILYPFLTAYYRSIEDYKNASMIQACWIQYLQFSQT
ncbi:helix-turn-helix domain-containing protein [Dubosiella newyorkensis]|uniref:HTH cro/C1-type domain-containing protein n=2 Tax=Dubosiella newyorkensis TaxID=1862672 RepID=A0A1U7NKD8_9FIRM|nr:helix-turn-helix transcriptional regulator [Dubosiella newyorkensis]OLU44625.1 hypothetical protein BO225_10300 [Dubosiella newyorkensis]